MASGSKGEKGTKRQPTNPVAEVEAAMDEDEGDRKSPVVKMSDLDEDALAVITRVAKQSTSKSNKVTEALKKSKGEPASVGQPTGRGSKGESASVGQPAGNESRGSASVGQPTGRHLEKKSFS